jgi:sulfite reductase (NADPH) flavoprotein alpha-component
MSESRWGNSLPAEIVPENAPFDEEQRAWLNGFLAGLLGLANGTDSSASAEPAPAGSAAGLAAGTAAAASVVGQASGAASASATAAIGASGGALGSREPSQRSGRAEPPSSGVAARRVLRTPVPDEPASATLPRPRSAASEPGSVQRLRVKSHRKLTLADAGSEIRELVLESTDTPLDYRAGDSLAVLPHNDPDLVRALLRAFGARGQELVSTPGGPVEVWRCLLEHVDITHVREQTLRLFAEEAGHSAELGALGEALSPSSPSSFDLLDLLALYPGARPSLERIIATLGPLEPRSYAIASAPVLYPSELHLAVRVVRAERGGRERRGVASHFLSEGVFRGDDVAARIHTGARFTLPPERTGPVIMVASGTGLARFRAILQELDVRGRRGNTWLIMASCFEGDEALYEPELRAWSRSGVLEHVDVIKLGQRGRRAGPEDVVRKRARRVASWFGRGALVYLCGEGKGLSSALSDTLVDVLGRQGKMSRAEAADLLHVMRRDGRYVEDVY